MCFQIMSLLVIFELRIRTLTKKNVWKVILCLTFKDYVSVAENNIL